MSVARTDPSAFTSEPKFSQPAAEALRLLLEAFACARDLHCDLWEFAVEIDNLHAAGITNSQLRWFLRKEYIAQAMEKSPVDGQHRSFRPVANLSLKEGTCFVLTEGGLAYLGEGGRLVAGGASLQPADQPMRPQWLGNLRELRLQDVVVKCFKQPATNQELILGAFEEEGWPPRIDDPLSPIPDQDAKRRLHSTIRNLNRSQANRLVHFEGGGDGQSIRWRLWQNPGVLRPHGDSTGTPQRM